MRCESGTVAMGAICLQDRGELHEGDQLQEGATDAKAVLPDCYLSARRR